MSTLFMLMAEFGSGDIPLRDTCDKYLGLDYKTAAYRANKQQLPFPVYRLGSQKSELLVSAKDMADYLDKKKEDATERWKAVNAT